MFWRALCDFTLLNQQKLYSIICYLEWIFFQCISKYVTFNREYSNSWNLNILCELVNHFQVQVYVCNDLVLSLFCVPSDIYPKLETSKFKWMKKNHNRYSLCTGLLKYSTGFGSLVDWLIFIACMHFTCLQKYLDEARDFWGQPYVQQYNSEVCMPIMTLLYVCQLFIFQAYCLYLCCCFSLNLCRYFSAD